MESYDAKYGEEQRREIKINQIYNQKHIDQSENTALEKLFHLQGKKKIQIFG